MARTKSSKVYRIALAQYFNGILAEIAGRLSQAEQEARRSILGIGAGTENDRVLKALP